MGIMDQQFEKSASKNEFADIVYKDLLKFDDFSAISEILDTKMENAENVKNFLDQTPFNTLEKIPAKIDRYRNEHKIETE